MSLVAVVVVVVLAAGATTAGAATYKYWDNSATPANSLKTSATASISGGIADSGCKFAGCRVEVRTTLSWPPYYMLFNAISVGYVELTHGVQVSVKSRCQHWWVGGGGSEYLKCWYRG